MPPTEIVVSPAALGTATGVGRNPVVEVLPQHAAAPPAVIAQEYCPYAANPVAPVTPATVNGTVPPFANCPDEFPPQHLIAPPETNAQVWSPAAEIATAPTRSATGTGVFDDVIDPLPSCP
jgi:hypothetical protein